MARPRAPLRAALLATGALLCCREGGEPGATSIGAGDPRPPWQQIDRPSLAACGICHEGEHRASMVPDLRTLPNATNAEYWKNSITHGKPNSLMPAFAQSQGGFLTDVQIEALVRYLMATMTPRPAPPTGIQPVPPMQAPAHTPTAGH